MIYDPKEDYRLYEGLLDESVVQKLKVTRPDEGDKVFREEVLRITEKAKDLKEQIIKKGGEGLRELLNQFEEEIKRTAICKTAAVLSGKEKEIWEKPISIGK